MNEVTNIDFIPILNSQGDLTLESRIHIKGLPFTINTSVPTGTSAGSNEPVQKTVHQTLEILRTYKFSQVLLDAAHDNLPIPRFDQHLLTIDPTPRKEKLGGNTTLLLSVTYAKLRSFMTKKTLYNLLRDDLELPRFMNNTNDILILFNMVNGGAHGAGLSIQEIKIGFPNTQSLLHQIVNAQKVWHQLIKSVKHNGLCTGIGKEGGLILNTNEENAFTLVIEAAEKVGLSAGDKAVLFLDVAANDFYLQELKKYKIQNQTIDNQELLSLYTQWIARYPIKGIEDPFAEFDIEGWKLLKRNPAFRDIIITGDDLTVTRQELIEKYTDLIDAIIVKPNQVGTLTETANAIKTALNHKLGITISHRSRETNDTWLSHLIAAVLPPRIKVGNIVRGERVAKINELLRISLDPQSLPV